MNIIYEHSYCDNILLAGDTNSKIGSSQEFIPGIDEDIGERIILDTTKNRHGQEMLDFLTESKMCVCNGRVTPEHNANGYTFVHTRGRSVIDYVCVLWRFWGSYVCVHLLIIFVCISVHTRVQTW